MKLFVGPCCFRGIVLLGLAFQAMALKFFLLGDFFVVVCFLFLFIKKCLINCSII